MFKVVNALIINYSVFSLAFSLPANLDLFTCAMQRGQTSATSFHLINQKYNSCSISLGLYLYLSQYVPLL